MSLLLETAAPPCPGLFEQSSVFVQPPFNYTGSKYRVLSQLLPLFDRSKRCLWDLFCGGGSVYTNAVDFYETVVANDIVGDLVLAHQGLITDPEGFAARTRALCPAKTDKEGYHRLRDRYNAEPSPEGLFALILSCNNNMCRWNRGLRFNQTFGARTYNASTEAKIRAWAAHMQPRVHKVSFLDRSFEKIWPACPEETFVFADPPYTNTEAGYNSFWSIALERQLYDYLHRLHSAGASFALCGVAGPHRNGRESWIIQQLISEGFHVTELENDFEVVAKKKGKTSREVVIRNYQTSFADNPSLCQSCAPCSAS